jgi:hypothetical protein
MKEEHVREGKREEKKRKFHETAWDYPSGSS